MLRRAGKRITSLGFIGYVLGLVAVFVLGIMVAPVPKEEHIRIVYRTEVQQEQPTIPSEHKKEPDTKPAEEEDPTSTKSTQLDPKKHHWFLGVCGSTASSSEWLREWLELQLISGVDHVWLLNDNKRGKDTMTKVILEEYQQRGFVTIIPEKHPEPPFPGCDNMWVAADCITPKLCHDYVTPYVDWWIFADTDEFIFPTMSCDLGHHLEHNCDPHDAFQWLRWERFGTSGHYEMPPGLMTENFLSSGGDCTDHNYNGIECKTQFVMCMECRHTKVLYNSQCVTRDHVGWIHEPVNTSFWKRQHRYRGEHDDIRDKYLPMQDHDESIYKSPICKERDIWKDSSACRDWAQHGGGSRFPPIASRDCCSAGFGYNHYGTKSKSKWDEKLATSTRRGFKADFGLVEMKSVISTSVLRFTRALRKRFSLLGVPVSQNVSFIDTAPGRACFVEDGWRYHTNKALGSFQILSNKRTLEACCSKCWTLRTGRKGRCSAWTFKKDTSTCLLFYGPYISHIDAEPLNVLRWPHSAVPISRTKEEGYVSGLVLHDGECPLPPQLSSPGMTSRGGDKRAAVPIPEVKTQLIPRHRVGRTPIIQKHTANPNPTTHSLLTPAHHWYLAVCGSAVTSAKGLHEWLELQLLAGIDHVWVLNAEGESQTILEDYQSKGFVTIIPKVPQHECEGAASPEDCANLKLCHDYVTPYVDWWIFADTDEFIFPTMSCDLGHHLEHNCDPHDAFQWLRWERFGTSGHYEMPPGLMTENFLSSGGDCTDHSAACTEQFAPCAGCRRTTMLYNTQCVTREHVGDRHEPVNTSFSSKEATPYKSSECTERSITSDSEGCRGWAQSSGGEQLPQMPGKACCSAGFGVNYYGTQAKNTWDTKMLKRLQDGGRQEVFSEVDARSVIGTGVLRFVRALRERLNVAVNSSFIDLKDKRGSRSCFVEDGWAYSAEQDIGGEGLVVAADSAHQCCELCFNLDEKTGQCSGFTFETAARNCTLVYTAFNSRAGGVDMGFLRWPRAAVAASRTKNSNTAAGVPLRDGECPIPSYLQ